MSSKDGFQKLTLGHSPIAFSASLRLATSSNNLLQWHNKLGHPSFSILRQILSKCNVHVRPNDQFVCEACQFGKAKQLPFVKSDSHSKFPLDLIHTDLWGPSPIQSNGGHRYYVHFIDDYSRYTWLFLLKHKFDVFTIFVHFK